MQIWSPVAGRMIPLSQVVSSVDVGWEDPVVMRRDRFPTVTIHADPRSGLPSELFSRVRGAVEKIKLPAGYSLQWGASTRTHATPGRRLPNRCRRRSR